MVILRLIFLIILAPFRWLTNLLTQHKNNILEWHLNYGSFFVKIETKYKEQLLADDLLISSYILFLARYFYICDDRQIYVVRNFLLEEIRKSQNTNEITHKLYEVVFQTLNQSEKDAVIGLFKIYNRFLSMPPLTFSEDKEPGHSFAKYNFLVYERSDNNGLGHIFHMSAGPDIILLPLTVGILYEYVTQKLKDKSKKEKLDNSIFDLLKNHSTVDCRTMTGQNDLPNTIISNNNLSY